MSRPGPTRTGARSQSSRYVRCARLRAVLARAAVHVGALGGMAASTPARCSPARPRSSPAGLRSRSPQSAPRSRPSSKPPASPRPAAKAAPLAGSTAEAAATHLGALGRLLPRLRADPTELARLTGLLNDAQREDLRWLCEALGVAPAGAAPAAAPPSHLLALPPPLLLRRVLGTLPVTALAAAACSCTTLRELSYTGGLEAWRTGGTLLLDCAAHLIHPASLARRGVLSIATTAAAVDMSDAQLGALLAGCPQLARISLEECDCLTDAAAPLLPAAPCLQDPKPKPKADPDPQPSHSPNNPDPGPHFSPS